MASAPAPAPEPLPPQRTSSTRNAAAAVAAAGLAGWASPIEGARAAEVSACAQGVVERLWPALKDAYLQELVEVRAPAAHAHRARACRTPRALPVSSVG
jgi:hypothetical protein